MESKKTSIISIANQKGGVGKTTSAINLVQALALLEKKVLLIDLDPQGNATQAMGIEISQVSRSLGDLIRDRSVDPSEVILESIQLDLIPSTPVLSQVEREMVGLTNSELRLRNQLQKVNGEYDFIVIDTPPTFGPLMNSALNSADQLLVPVDCGFFALMGIKEILTEVEEIRQGTNPNLNLLGCLVTFFDRTNIAKETLQALEGKFWRASSENQDRTLRQIERIASSGKNKFFIMRQTHLLLLSI